MKEDTLLAIASLLAMVLGMFHIAADIVYGFSPGGLSNLTVTAVTVVWLYATFILAKRRTGYWITLVLSLLYGAMPVLHFMARGVGAGSRVAKTGGAIGFFFIWTLFALGATGLFAMILAARGLWRLRA